MKLNFKAGLIDGIPIALGYLSVSFGVGILAARAGIRPGMAAVLSAANVTSAGEAAGINIMAAGGTLIEMAVTQFVINLRYALMALSLTQKLDSGFTTPHRLLASYGITDEIFGVAISKNSRLTPAYLYGMISISAASWTLGTFLGAAAGELLPKILTNSLGIMLYGMFIAIFIPASRRDRHAAFAVILASGFSILVAFLLPRITSGFSVILCSVAASALAAWLFPHPEETAEKEAP